MIHKNQSVVKSDASKFHKMRRSSELIIGRETEL